jgi:hypothetical protein
MLPVLPHLVISPDLQIIKSKMKIAIGASEQIWRDGKVQRLGGVDIVLAIVRKLMNWYTSRNDDYPKRVGAKLGGHFRFGQAALQHRDRGQEIAASGSQISGEDRVRAIGKIGDTHPLLLVSDVGLEKLNAPTQISGERLQFHGSAGMVQCVRRVARKHLASNPR